MAPMMLFAPSRKQTFPRNSCSKLFHSIFLNIKINSTFKVSLQCFQLKQINGHGSQLHTLDLYQLAICRTGSRLCCQPLFPNTKAFDLQRNSGRTTFATRSLIISAVLSAIACFIDLPLISQPSSLGL